MKISNMLSEETLFYEFDNIHCVILPELEGITERETMNWARATGESDAAEEVKHLDSNGTVLQAGDTVTLIKDLNVKGANFIAKRGTAVRGISLVADNPEHIEGKINGQRIVILTKFVKKSS